MSKSELGRVIAAVTVNLLIVTACGGPGGGSGGGSGSFGEKGTVTTIWINHPEPKPTYPSTWTIPNK